nr:helix-turn-helix transcriptional regulator [Paenibacillus soyae]
MKGRVDTNAALAQAFESYGLRFEEDRFAVMLLQVEDYSALFRSNQELDAEKKLQFVSHIVTNVAMDMAAGRCGVYFAESDGMIACLLNMRNKEAEAKTELMELAAELRSFLQDKFFMRLTIGLSDIHTMWSSIPRCYEEAEEALEYKLVLGASQVIAFEAIKKPKNELYYPLDAERQLINLMASGDYEGASDVLQRILMTNFSEGTLSIQVGKLLMFEVVGTMLKAVEQFQLTTNEIRVEKTAFIKKITDCETFAEMEAEIVALLREVCDYLQQKKKSHNADLKNEVVDYVLDNLTDMNISLTSISLEFGINPSYLSRFFKEQTGENLVDFINKRRIEKVKGHLEASEEPIGAIAEQCGFASSQSLIRVFKKYEGVTPGQFRQNTSVQAYPH